jgi:hypothetical protein
MELKRLTNKTSNLWRIHCPGNYLFTVRASQYHLDVGPAVRSFGITPALGGSDDIRNLWPHSYSATKWNARVKDELEDCLHALVCEGQLDPSTAQREIAGNWIMAYKKHMHTDQPLDRRQ